MNGKTFYWILSILLVMSNFVLAEQYEQLRIAKIDLVPEGVSPNSSFDSHAVRSRLQTKAGNYFSQSEFDQDLKSLSEEYDKVAPSLKVRDDKLYITLKVWLRPTIGTLQFCGNEKVKTRKLQKELGITAGSLFDREEFIKAFNKVKALYVKKGYFESELDYDICSDPEKNVVNIQIIIREGRAGEIRGIIFKGFTKCEKKELKALMVTKQHICGLNLITGRGRFHPEMVEHDRRQILNYLQNEGYADASVTITSREKTDEKNMILLDICAEKGVRYTFGNTSFSGNTLYSDDQIWPQFQFARGQLYSPDKLRCTVKAIRDLYGSCGYIDAAVDVRLSLRENCPIYDVAVTIEEGEQYCVGMVRVFGNQCTETRVILNESLICPGELFNIKKLEGTETRLRNTGFFSNVNVYAVKTSEDSCYRDVYIEVEETDTGNVGVFLGANSLDSIFGGVELTERNFNLGGIPQVLTRGPGALRGGGEYAHFKVNVGKNQTSYLGQWSKPYFLDTPWILGVDADKTDNRTLSRAYELKTYGGTVHATYIFNDYLKFDIHYRARKSHNSIGDDSNALLDEEASISGFLSAAGFSLLYDSTDHPRYPTSGFRSRFIYELSGLGGNFEFMKFAYLNAYYYPFTKKDVLKFKAELQFIHTYGGTTPITLPLSERLYLGGETTIRGYRNYIIGPKFGNNEPRGGVSSLLLSEELQHNILENPRVDGFVFMDAGYVSLSEFTIGRYAASAGFGARIEIMRNVPMTFGIGYPIHPSQMLGDLNINNAKRFFFSVGAGF
ncbi:MAG: Outer membrane protein assembly factor BamA [Chlamydiae bacterium]|nr:Outer membrane protein assembly factor BamA [Chlamydiota bacterium]